MKRSTNWLMLIFMIFITLFALVNVIQYSIEGKVTLIVLHSFLFVFDCGLVAWAVWWLINQKKRDEKYVDGLVKHVMLSEAVKAYHESINAVVFGEEVKVSSNNEGTSCISEQGGK